MSVFILIDTNIWLHELLLPDNDDLLGWLKTLTENGKIKLLIPTTLRQEWIDQSASQIKQQQTKTNETRNVTRQSNDVASSLTAYMDKLRDREKLIAGMFGKGVQVVESDEVDKETMRRYRAKLAPFHAKNKSNADSLIYFSCIEHSLTNEVGSFFFITQNSSDFGDPAQPKTALHPQLLVEGVSIQYYNSLEAVRYFLQSEPGFNPPVLPELPAVENRNIVTVLPQNQANLLDHLFTIFTEIHKQMAFVPCHLLVRIEPFKIQGTNKIQSYAYYSNFTINTNNPLLLDFFESIDFTDAPRFTENAAYENTPENLDKLKYVIRSLNHNLIFHFSDFQSSRTFDIRPAKKNKKCDCLVCQYERMELGTVFNRLKNRQDEDPSDLAFVGSLVGFNEIAAASTIRLLENAYQEKKDLLYYRLLFHIRWLEQLVYTNNGIVDRELLSKWKQVDLNEVYGKLNKNGGFWKDCADYFLNQFFEGYYVLDVYESVQKIEEHYIMQMRGGTSNNSNLQSLSAAFTEFELFLKNNRVPFFRFSNFSRVFEQYTCALFMSFSLNEYQSSRIISFNDLVVRQFILYGSPDVLIKMGNRYARKGVPYSSDDANRSSKTMILNFLRDYPVLMRAPEDQLPEKIHLNQLQDRWRSILVVLSLVNFDKAFIRECNQLIYNDLSTRNLESLGATSELESFLATRLKFLTKADQLKWLRLCLSKKTFQEPSIIFAFTPGNLGGSKIFTSERDWKLFCNNLLPRYAKENSFNWGIIVSLFEIMGEGMQAKMIALVTGTLKKETNLSLFCAASIRGIVKDNVLFIKYTNYLTSMKPPNKSDRRFLMEGEIFMREVNDFINVCFYLKRNIPKKLIAHLKGCSDYYDWLLDMKKFNYGGFNVLWAIQYPTKYYLAEIFAVRKVCDAVKEWLRFNTHEHLAKYYTLYAGIEKE